MTKRKHLKQRVRQRSAKTGESYTAALRRLRSRTEEATVTSEATTLSINCSFCNKLNTEVRKLIAGPGVYVCDECIALCNNILDEAETGGRPSPEKAPSLEDGPVDRLLWIFGGMAETARSMDQNLAAWATKLRERGVTTAELARAAKLSEAEAAERFGT